MNVKEEESSSHTFIFKMAFKRRRYTRKRAPAKRAIAKVVRQLCPKSELKSITVGNVTPTQIGSGGANNLMCLLAEITPGIYSTVAGFNNAIPTGTSNQGQRIGKTINVVRTEVTCWVQVNNPGAMPPGGDSVRCVVYVDKEARGTSTTVGDLFQANAFGVGVISAMSMYRIDNMKRFSILHDDIRPMVVGPVIGAGNSANQVAIFRFVVNRKYSVEYNGTTGVTSEFVKNNLYMYMTTEAPIAAAWATVTMQARTWYTDA